MSYICKCCEYETSLKTNYNRHLLSSKHLKKSSSLNFDNKKENPAVLNQKLIEGIEIMKENYEIKLKKQEQLYKEQIEGQAKQILRLKKEIEKLTLNN